MRGEGGVTGEGRVVGVPKWVLVNRETKRNAKRNETEATPTMLLLPRKRIISKHSYLDSLQASTLLER